MLSLLLLLPGLGAGCTVAPLSAALRHYSDRQLSDGLVFGILLLRGQLFGASLLSKESGREINQLMKLCDSILEKNHRSWINVHMIKRLSRGVLWLKEGTADEVGLPVSLNYRLEDHLLSESQTPRQSTACILEALTNAIISPDCYKQETNPTATGYTLSHQAIYFLLQAAMRRNTHIRNNILPKLCKKMLAEVTYIWRRELPSDLVDLLIEEEIDDNKLAIFKKIFTAGCTTSVDRKIEEFVKTVKNVAVCGLGNFNDFLSDPTHEVILTLQADEGCFSLRKLDPTADKCEDHLSAVSMVALGNFIYRSHQNCSRSTAIHSFQHFN